MFANIGAYQGKNDVLAIGISSADAYNNRPSAYQDPFYNTQGKAHAVAGGAGDNLTASLFLDSSWADPSNGAIRTDMWGVVSNSASAVVDYPIIGFTNYGGAPRFRIWDDMNGVWDDLTTNVNFNSWVSFEILFTGSAFNYLIDGTQVASLSSDTSAVGFSSVIMQAYNFGGDPSIKDAVANDYTAHWANPADQNVPEPASIALVGVALLGAGFARRRVR